MEVSEGFRQLLLDYDALAVAAVRFVIAKRVHAEQIVQAHLATDLGRAQALNEALLREYEIFAESVTPFLEMKK